TCSARPLPSTQRGCGCSRPGPWCATPGPRSARSPKHSASKARARSAGPSSGPSAAPRPKYEAPAAKPPSWRHESVTVHAAIPLRAGRLSAVAWMSLGGLAIGTLDLAFAWAYWQSHGVTCARILQSVAAGVLGEASFAGGMTSATLGACLHYFIATMFVVVYRFAGRRHAGLRKHPVSCGL